MTLRCDELISVGSFNGIRWHWQEVVREAVIIILLVNYTIIKRKCISCFHQVIDFTPTDSYLDNCMFNQMLEHTRKHPDKPRGVEEWILKGSNYHKPSCVSATFDSLVKLGLLGKKPKLMGTCLKYPTLNSGNLC